jgi:hypothetical protein
MHLEAAGNAADAIVASKNLMREVFAIIELGETADPLRESNRHLLASSCSADRRRTLLSKGARTMQTPCKPRRPVSARPWLDQPYLNGGYDSVADRRPGKASKFIRHILQLKSSGVSSYMSAFHRSCRTATAIWPISKGARRLVARF